MPTSKSPAQLVTATDLEAALHLPAAVPGLTETAAAAAELIGWLVKPDEDHSTHAACREAALLVAVELWQARQTSGGQPIALDFQPIPSRVSVYTTRRVHTLLGKCLAMNGWVG